MFTYRLDDCTQARLLRSDDAEAFYRLIDENRDYIGRWIPWVGDVQSVAERLQAIERTCKFPESGWCDVGIWWQGVLAGVCGLHGLNPAARSASFHYYLGEAFVGKGLMTRTCAAMVDELLTSGNYNRLVINAATVNTRSAAIPERLGFQHEGVLRQSYALNGQVYDLAVYAMLYEDWQAG